MSVSSYKERYREIAEVLARHGLGFLIGIAGLEKMVPFHRGLLGHKTQQSPVHEPRTSPARSGRTRPDLHQVGPDAVHTFGPVACWLSAGIE